MGYQEALEAAGAEVLAFEEFGSYQGDWWAKVRYNGVEGWVNGSYGSCSACDAFEGEFGWHEGGVCGAHEFKKPEPDCPLCKETKEKYQKRLAEFGRPYLEGILTQGSAERAALEHASWDADADTMWKWLKANAIGKVSA